MPAHGIRKARCPKCTALLIEPRDGIYECPICSALLLAKGSSDGSALGSQDSRFSSDGRYVDGAFAKTQERLESVKVQPGVQPVMNQRKVDMSYAMNKNLSEHARTFQNNSPPKHGLMPRISALQLSRARDIELRSNGGSSVKSEEGDRFSELSSASYTESDYEGDSALQAPEDRVPPQSPDLASAVDPVNGYAQKEGRFNDMDVPYPDESNSKAARSGSSLLDITRSRDVQGASVSIDAQGRHEYDNGSHSRSMQVDSTEESAKSQASNEYSNVPADDRGMNVPKVPGRKLFDLTVFGILNENAFNDIKRGKHASTVKTDEVGDLGKNSPSTQDSVKSEKKQESWIEKSDVANTMDHIGQSNNDPKLPVRYISAAVHEQNTEHRSTTVHAKRGYSDEVPSAVGLNTQVLSDTDADALVEARYGNVLSEKDISPDIPVDVSFGDWKSPRDVPEQRDKVTGKIMINLDEGDFDEWDEDNRASGIQKDMRIMRTVEEPQSFQHRVPLMNRENTSQEWSAVPLRTAAMQKFLQHRTDQENKTMKHVDPDDETSLYEAPYDFNHTLQRNVIIEESNGEKASIVASNMIFHESHDQHLDPVQSPTARPMHLNETHALGIRSSTVKDVNSKESDSESSKHSYMRIDKTGHVKMEAPRNFADLSLQPLPSRTTRRSTLQWKGKSTVTEFEIHTNAEDIHSHGGHSQFYVNGEHGSDLWPTKQHEERNTSFDKENGPFQQSNATRRNAGSSNLNSLRISGQQERTQINRSPVRTGGNMDYNNKRPVQSQESRFYGPSREEYPGGLYDSSNEIRLPLPLPLQGSTSPNLHEKFINLNSHHCHSPSCTFCTQPQYDRQQPLVHQNSSIHQRATYASQPSARSYRSVHDDLSHNVEILSNSSNSYRGRNPPPKSQRRIRSKMQSQFFADIEQVQRFHPPLPDRSSSAPYIFCNGCNQILEVPSYLPPNRGPLQKLKCGTCRKVSKFSIHLHEGNKASFVDNDSGMHGYQHENESDPFMDTASECSLEQIPLERGRREQSGTSLILKKNGSTIQSQGYFQGKPDASSISDHESYPRTMGTLWQGRSGYGKSNIKAYSEGYSSSTASSASGSSPRKQKVNFERADFGEEIQSENLHAGSKMHGENEPYMEAIFSDDVSHRTSDVSRNRIAHASSQGHLVNMQRQRAASWQNQDADVDFNSNSSGNNISQSKQISSGPINSIQDSQIANSVLYQERPHKDSSDDGPRSAPWSPAVESPLSSQKTKDGEREWRSLSPQNETKGTKFFAEFITKGFRDIGKGYRAGNRGKVIVNGHLIPDAAVRKAEEKAGSIHPGSYWYDYNAGFWGLMGGPCQGVVMSHIKEFNFPMEKGCAGGKTGVLVNGRELHEKDLEVLAKRGLPKVAGMAYVMDMQGNVRDEATGQQLKGLGKLAPSIEKKGCGWGMFQSVGKH